MAQSDDVIMMRDVGRRDRLHAAKMKAFFDLTDQPPGLAFLEFFVDFLAL